MTSMQTAEPLPEVRLNMTTRPVSWLYPVTTPGQQEFDVDQPYQRGDVWGLTRRRNLIRSLIMGVPIPSLVINDRGNGYFHHVGYDEIRSEAYAIVDGKQRATTYGMFGADEFSIPASWLKPDWIETVEDTVDGPYVRRSGLSLGGRRRFDRCPVAVSEARFRTMAEEQLVFDLVNFGGVAQGETDKDVLAPR
jgi:hypothetical protein